MRPTTWPGWLVVVLVLVAAAAVAERFLAAFVQAVHLVDMVPGADAGIATSPELEAARASSLVWGLLLLGLGVGTAAVLLSRHRRSARRSRPGFGEA